MEKFLFMVQFFMLPFFRVNAWY